MKTYALPLGYQGVVTTASAPQGREIVARKGKAVSLMGKERGLRIECRAGSAWITQTGDGRDIVLNAGEASWLAGSGRIVVEGIGAEAICWVSD